MKKRLHAYYSGTVQGVGFRFTAERIATSLGLTGWIANLDDGRVEIVCEGDAADLVEFLEKAKDAFGGYIWQVDVRYEKPSGEFQGFNIR